MGFLLNLKAFFGLGRAARNRTSPQQLRFFRRSGRDRRRAYRVKSMDLVKFEIQSPRGEKLYRIANLKDISETGVQFMIKDEIPKDAKVRVCVNLMYPTREIYATGKTAWVKESYARGADAKYHHVGISFSEIAVRDRELIRNYVHTLRLSPDRRDAG